MIVFSFILGILSLILSVLSLGSYGFCAPVGMVLGITGLVIGCIQQRENHKDRMVTAAIICSSIGIVANVLFFFFFMNAFSGAILQKLFDLLCWY